MQFKTRSIRTRVTTKQIDFILLCILFYTKLWEDKLKQIKLMTWLFVLIEKKLSKNNYTHSLKDSSITPTKLLTLWIDAKWCLNYSGRYLSRLIHLMILNATVWSIKWIAADIEFSAIADVSVTSGGSHDLTIKPSP